MNLTLSTLTLTGKDLARAKSFHDALFAMYHRELRDMSVDQNRLKNRIKDARETLELSTDETATLYDELLQLGDYRLSLNKKPKSVSDEGLTEDEMLLFVEVCRARGFDRTILTLSKRNLDAIRSATDDLDRLKDHLAGAKYDKLEADSVHVRPEVSRYAEQFYAPRKARRTPMTLVVDTRLVHYAFTTLEAYAKYVRTLGTLPEVEQDVEDALKVLAKKNASAIRYK